MQCDLQDKQLGKALVHSSTVRGSPVPAPLHPAIAYDSGMPSSAIRFRMLQASRASPPCATRFRA